LACVPANRAAIEFACRHVLARTATQLDA